MSLEEDATTLSTSDTSTSTFSSALASRADISAVSSNLKLPPFWPSDPELWFAQVEDQFACQHITSQRSMFNYIVSSLTPEFAVEVWDLLLKPPADNPYNQLKEQLTKCTTASEQRKLQLLFHREELGDRKPTQLLRRMQQLLGDRTGLDTSLLRELFLQRLLPNVRMVLASTPESATIEKLAEMANKIMDVASSSVSALSKAPPEPDLSSTFSNELKQLQSDVARLEKLVHKLAHNRSSSRGNHHSSRRSPTPTPDDSFSSPCWYHSRYGDQAKKCHPPCTWQPNKQAGH